MQGGQAGFEVLREMRGEAFVDVRTGKQLWRRWTVPAPGEPGSETWPNATQPDAWKYGGAATWQPVTYDPELDLVFVGTGNAEPWNPAAAGREGARPPAPRCR